MEKPSRDFIVRRAWRHYEEMVGWAAYEAPWHLDQFGTMLYDASGDAIAKDEGSGVVMDEDVAAFLLFVVNNWTDLVPKPEGKASEPHVATAPSESGADREVRDLRERIYRLRLTLPDYLPDSASEAAAVIRECADDVAVRLVRIKRMLDIV